MGAIILSIKMAAICIAIAVTMVLIYDYEFRWYTALALGALGYVASKSVLAVVVGYVWGRQDAREVKQQLVNLRSEVRQDIIDCAPPDVKEHVANFMKSVPRREGAGET